MTASKLKYFNSGRKLCRWKRVAHIASPQTRRPVKYRVYRRHTHLYVDFSWDSVARKYSFAFGVNAPLVLVVGSTNHVASNLYDLDFANFSHVSETRGTYSNRYTDRLCEDQGGGRKGIGAPDELFAVLKWQASAGGTIDLSLLLRPPVLNMLYMCLAPWLGISGKLWTPGRSVISGTVTKYYQRSKV